MDDTLTDSLVKQDLSPGSFGSDTPSDGVVSRISGDSRLPSSLNLDGRSILCSNVLDFISVCVVIELMCFILLNKPAIAPNIAITTRMNNTPPMIIMQTVLAVGDLSDDDSEVIVAKVVMSSEAEDLSDSTVAISLTSHKVPGTVLLNLSIINWHA